MSAAKPVVLDELGRRGQVCRLDHDHADALRTTGLVQLRRLGGGRFRLLSAGRVGAVRIGDLDVEVRPKMPINRLLFMLGYANHPGFTPEDVGGATEPDLWPALAESLARRVDQALRPGVLQGYRTRDDALPLVRGRIRVADQLARRPGGWLPVEVSYDDYAVDTVENRLLRTALRRMASVPRLREDHRVRLGHLDARLDGVAVLPPAQPLPAWQLTRQNARYAPALWLAEVVLRNQSAEPGPGGLTIAGFVVQMARVFEDFVGAALTEALAGYLGRTDTSYRDYLDEGEWVEIKPDVVQLVAGRPVAVFDAKYKLARRSGRYANADLFQMLSYCTALGLTTGWLVYAHGAAPSGVRRIRNSGVTIILHPLDLAAEPRDLLRQIDELAHQAIEVKRATE
jgi:5-methylcytosine-specific restriction enzyme subunit McrC